MRSATIAVAVVVVVGIAAAAQAQTRRIVGTSISGELETKADQGTTVETSRLLFPGAATPEFTVDFIARYDTARRQAPRVVDLVITEYEAGDERPGMSLQADGRAVEVQARLRSRRSIVASMPFDEFVQLVNAETIVERAFGAELVFGAGQMRMLRTVADRWNAR